MKRSARRERIQRVESKRPLVVDVKTEPCPRARENLIDVLLELLDPHVRSGRR